MKIRVAIVAVATALAIVAPATAAAPRPRASLTDIESDVMCTACHTPLAVSQSPEAASERQFISGLIAEGQTKAQIENALVANYGPQVLALPPASGFNLTIYVLPPAIVLAGIALLALVLPRWRRRSRAAAAARPAAAGPALEPAAARRLEEELASYDG